MADELRPPTPERVAQRAVVLSCLVARASIEGDANEEWASDAAERARGVIDEASLWNEVEPEERELLETPLGSLDERAVLNGGWRVEGLAVLAWALGRLELPPYDVEVDVQAVIDALGMADGDVPEELLAQPQLRPPSELEDLAEALFAAHWRIREFESRPRPIGFVEFAREAWFGPMQVESVPLADGDLAVGGTAIAEADPAAVQTAHSILIERRIASGWLLGQDEMYSAVPLDT